MITTLKFLVDVGVGKKVEKWLAENGYDVKYMRDINPKADDSATGLKNSTAGFKTV